ncbi:MAG: laccase domain-containing protein [Eggerthellaceae bacterium]|nr:laccase domain-containing protein [Eggerthellaceae bacterium]
MAGRTQLPLPQLDALPLGAHRALRALTDEGLYEACDVRIAFTNREGGVSEGPYASLNCGAHVEDDPAAVARNRQIVLDALGTPNAKLIVPNQVHGTNIVCVGQGNADEVQDKAAEGADALVVIAPDVAALLNFADCLPLIVVAPSGAFAVGHGGWRGAVAHIASKAALELAAQTGEDTAQFNAYIGPHIRSECFEVGVEVAEQFAAEFGASVVEGERHVSLARAVACDLVAAGLEPQRIADCGICTKCNPDRYFSYRATQGCCGRHSAVAVRHAR